MPAAGWSGAVETAEERHVVMIVRRMPPWRWGRCGAVAMTGPEIIASGAMRSVIDSMVRPVVARHGGSMSGSITVVSRAVVARTVIIRFVIPSVIVSWPVIAVVSWAVVIWFIVVITGMRGAVIAVVAGALCTIAVAMVISRTGIVVVGRARCRRCAVRASR